MLRARYRNVYQQDICLYAKEFEFYDAIIMGDVFEHIEFNKAKEFLKDIRGKCTEVYIVVPYLYPQGEVGGNPFETHQQDDLTPENMSKRYPELQLVDSDGAKGLYVWK